MSILSDPRARRTPWHLWVVGVLALLWNSMGALDYLMTQTRNEQYLSMFTPEQLAFFESFPAWVVASWALAVWCGVLGAILLLLRKRLAVWFLFFSLIAMIVTTVHNFGFADGMRVMGDPLSLAFTVAIFVIAVALFFYAGIMNRNNILR